MKNIKDILSIYKSGTYTDEDLQDIEELLSTGKISMSDLEDVTIISEAITHSPNIEAMSRMDQSFYAQIHNPKSEVQNKYNKWIVALCIAVFFLTALCFYLLGKLNNQEVQQPALSPDMFASTLLNEDKVEDRIHLISSIPKHHQLDNNALDVLLYSLVSDKSINVRLASLNSLKRYTSNPFVRQGLINAISFQDSPIVLLYIREALSSSGQSLNQDEFSAKINKETRQKFDHSLKLISL